MEYLIMLFGGVAWGVIFESFVAVPLKGFYIVTVLVMAVIYALSSFRLVAATIFVSALCGIAFFIIVSFALTNGAFPSMAFLIHGVVFVVLSELILYGFEKKTPKQY